MTKKIYKVKGMDCSACATLIEVELEDLGIKARCSYAKQTIEFEDGDKKNPEDKIRSIVASLGYILE